MRVPVRLLTDILKLLLGPTCKRMCSLRSDAVFLSAAFKPTSEDLQAATRRKFPVTQTSQFTSNARTSRPGASSRMIVDSDSDSDDSLPDISSIIKSSEAARGQAKGKAKASARASSPDDDDSEEDVGVCLLDSYM